MRMKKTIWKKTLSMVLSLAMTAGLLTAMGKPLTVEAASEIPSATKFATKNELMNGKRFNLDGSGIAQLVYFGTQSGSRESQPWYIAGYDPAVGSLVLICDPRNPMISSMGFTSKSGYRTEIGIDGIYEGQKPSLVCTNHYGASDLRSTLRSIESNLYMFTKSEQELMKETTVYTYDKENKTVYATKDKLYAAYGEYGNDYISVGANASALSMLNQGLRVSLRPGEPFSCQYPDGNENPYPWFWLRNPNRDSSDKAYCVSGNDLTVISDGPVKALQLAVVPAFALNVESVLFASAAPIETETDTDGGELNEAMIMRMDDNSYNKVRSTVNYTYDANGDVDGVAVQKNRNEATDSYLYVQGKDEAGDWYYSEKITGRQEIKFADISRKTTPSDCRIWIETTVDNLTYAKLAGTVAVPKASLESGTYTTNQTVALTSITKDATIYYTTDGSTPTTNSTVYEEEISIKGRPGESVTTIVRAIAVKDDMWDSMEATFMYVINLPHTHSWSDSWANDSKGHWHECTTVNCTITEDSGKDGYAAHTEDKGTVTTAPTVTSTGVKTYKCSVCGYTMRTETLPKAAQENQKPAAKNTTLTAAAQNCQLKVTSSSATNPTVTYMKSTNNNAATITVPATITVNGVAYKVTGIAANAFANNKKITKVTIGKNVTSIGKNAFKNCKKLKTVTINSTVLKTIGANAFYGDKSLKTITLKSTMLTSKSVGKNALKGTNKGLTIKAPKKKVAAYKKFFKKKGNKKVTVR